MDWNTRLVVQFTDDAGDHTISPIDSFSPSFSLGAEPIHSIEQTHIGVIFSPKSMNFSITVKAIGDVVARLTQLALNGTRFNIALLESDGNDWSFTSVVMTDCIISSCSPTNASPSGAPGATFSGFSLASTVTPKPGLQAVSVP